MSKSKKSFLTITLLGALFILIILILPSFFKSTYSANVDDAIVVEVPKEIVLHVDTPKPLKAIYMTACVAGTPSWRENLKSLIETTELNAVVIDIKDSTGSISFPNEFPKLDNGKGCVVKDLKDFIKELHESNIYVIGRISVFQDPSYGQLFPELAVKSKSSGGVWKDRKGLSFIDVGAKPYWDFIVELSKASYDIGFDEINYDYVRYPSDGNMQDTSYSWTPYQDEANSSSTGQAIGTTTPKVLMTKPEVLESFFSYLHKEMRDVGAKTSVDLFGMTTTVENDMNIGQVLEKALPYFDYIAPMVYPSHYPATWNGFTNPADHPYDVIKLSMSRGVERETALNISNGLATSTPSKLRPWLQDFNLGATYDATKVRAQIQASYDIGLDSWMLWNAGNKYTGSALLSE